MIDGIRLHLAEGFFFASMTAFWMIWCVRYITSFKNSLIMKTLKHVNNEIFAILSTGFLFIFLHTACKKSVDTAGGGELPRDVADINQYISNLQYDPDKLLNVQPTAGAPSARIQKSKTNNPQTRTGGYYVNCSKTTYNLQTNFEDVAILKPTNGIIFPGALVKGDASLMDGSPTPIPVPRSPVALRIDLPGIGENGNLTVANPNNSTVQSEIDKGLQWWNNNAYQEGYVNPAHISYKASTSYSQQQLALDVDMNVEWASNSVAAQFSSTSTSTKKVAMMSFKQGFYTVTMNTPQTPAEVFGKDVTLAQVQGMMNSDEPPAYVHSVVYGRILMFKMESTSDASSTEIETALKYSTGVVNLSGATKTRIESILKTTSTTIISIGGNAAVASQAVTARSFGDLAHILKGENAVYSKSNPGVPIAYTVRYLKNNTIAKLGYTTDYAVDECKKTAVPGAEISVQNDGGYVAYFALRYKDINGVDRSMNTGSFSSFMVRKLTLPAGAHNITLDVDYHGAFSWYDFFEKTYTVPVKKCFKLWGTAFSVQHGEISCN